MLYHFIRGQLVSIAFVIFILGLIFQLIQFFKLTKKKEWFYPPLEVKPEKKTVGKWVAFCLASLDGTLWKTDPLITVVTSVFHVFLILVPLLLLGHNILLDQSWGLSLWSLPESVTDILTLVFLICVAFFLGRRLFPLSGPRHHDGLRLSHLVDCWRPIPDGLLRLPSVV